MAQLVDVPGHGVVEFPDGMTDDQIAGAIKANMTTSAPVKPAKQQELSIGEKLVSALPDSVQSWLLNPSIAGVGIGKGSGVNGAMMGAADPVVGLTQLAANVVNPITKSPSLSSLVTGQESGLGDKVNRAISAKEAEYQAARKNQGRDGFDAARIAGGVAITAPIGGGIAAPATLAGKIGQGAAMGAALGATNPVTEGDYWSQKTGQVGAGALGGALAAPVASALARVVRPNAIDRVSGLDGVNPTIGQTLGGWVGRMEEKAQSVPILGDAIMAARNRAKEEFNRATINKAVAPIGESVNEIGHTGVAKAGDKLSEAYDAALTKLGGVKFDPQFSADLQQLRGMAASLTPDMAKRFESILNDHLLSRVSPNGSMVAETLKQAESEIGKKAVSFSSRGGAEGELGDALAQLKSLIRQQVGRASPEAAAAVKAADEGWANLVRVEGAAKGAKGTEGVFTPGQLLTAVRHADNSVRDRATARGTALMQDWASKGQSVLGNKYPDSGTAGRLMLGAGGLATGAVNPAIPAALVAGSSAYLPPIQRLLVAAATKRPGNAAALAQLLRNSSPALVPAGNALAQALKNDL